jgi:hypothetical protein
MKITGVIALSFLFLFAAVVVSGAGELSDLEKAVEEQERELEELRKKVEEMEERRSLEEEAAREMEELRPQFGSNLGVFGDINFTTDSREKENESFSLGEIDLYSTASYRDRLNFLFELLIEFDEDGDAEVDVERLWAGYTISDLLTVRAGKFHTALGYWNKAFHHGKHLFSTVERPFFIAFEDEDGVVPVHIVGLELAGSADIWKTRVKYWLQVGNEPRIIDNQLDPNDVSDDDDSKQVALRVSLNPRRFPGLSVGLFATHFPVETPLKRGLDENIFGLDLHYAGGGVEFISEYFFFDNSVASANAFYVQLSRTFDRLTPYTRYELLDVESDDPYMSALAGGIDRYQYIAGLRYDIDFLHSSIKAQYRYDDAKDFKDFNVFEAQWTFHF